MAVQALQVFRLPDLGEGLTEAELVHWLVAVGDTVVVDEPIAEVETAKSIVEVPSPYAGVVQELHGEPGSAIAVGSPLISVAASETRSDVAAATPSESEPSESESPANESPESEAPANESIHSAAEQYRTEEQAGSGNVLIGYGTSVRSVGKRTRTRRGSEPAVTTATAPTPKPLVISPLVRRLARENGLILSSITGSGDGGLITRLDVENAIATEGAPAPAPAAETVNGEFDLRSGLPIRNRSTPSMFRKTVARTLSQSRREIPEATVWVDVDATRLLALRRELAQDGVRTPGVLSLVARFVVAGLQQFPALNGRIEPESGDILEFDGVNLGIAAQTDRGLAVPAIRNAHAMTVRQLDAEIVRLADVARSGRATTAELTGSTFTLNNYGVFGVDGSAAIINYPEVAILGLGRIIDRPWVLDGQIVPRSITQLSIVFDHRVCDGGVSAGFLRFVADAIEKPQSLFADL